VTDEQPDPATEEVRRLLAQARHTEPMPADVAARMDAVLADLAGTPESTPTPAPVVPLSRARRRRAAGLLVAAAAIVVGGVTVAQHLPTSHPDASPSSAAGADTGSSGFDRSSGSTQGPEAGGRQPAPQDLSGGKAVVRKGRVLVRPDHFTADALAARGLVTPGSTQGYTAGLDRISPACVAVPTDSTVLRATYERAPAALVFHQPASSSQVVDLYVCGSRRPIRSATLPQP
jgi:hypothetical protein